MSDNVKGLYLKIHEKSLLNIKILVWLKYSSILINKIISINILKILIKLLLYETLIIYFHPIYEEQLQVRSIPDISLFMNVESICTWGKSNTWHFLNIYKYIHPCLPIAELVQHILSQTFYAYILELCMCNRIIVKMGTRIFGQGNIICLCWKDLIQIVLDKYVVNLPALVCLT